MRTLQCLRFILKLPNLKLRRLVEQLSANELRAIVKIDEPDTFKVGEDDLSADVIKKLGLT